MARRVKTLPIASASGPSNIEISETDWAKLEDANNRLPEAVRVKILERTNLFVNFARFESTAEPQRLAREWVNAVKRDAAELQRTLLNDEQHDEQRKWRKDESDAYFYAKSLIKKHFSHAGFRGEDDPSEYLIRFLTSLKVACHNTLTELDGPQVPEFRRGECWDLWICRLTEILGEAELPTAARTDDVGADSQFTKLVEALQDLVPSQIRRATHSRGALAKAIQRARARYCPVKETDSRDA